MLRAERSGRDWTAVGYERCAVVVVGLVSETNRERREKSDPIVQALRTNAGTETACAALLRSHYFKTV